MTTETMSVVNPHCDATDMHVDALGSIGEKGIDEEPNRCFTLLESTGGLPARPVIDEYRSAVCDQLCSVEPFSPGTRRSPSKTRRGVSQAPRSQNDVVLSCGSLCVSFSKRTAVVHGSVEKIVFFLQFRLSYFHSV